MVIEADLELIKPGPKNPEVIKRHGWEDKFVGLYIGAHGRANHLWQLIETAKILKDEPEFMIACVGGGMERQALMEKVKAEGLTNIQFIEPVSKNEVGLYLNTCDVSLIVLKKVNAFKTVYPNKMFDAMSSACPIVIAIDGVARKLVTEDAQSGTYVEPENAHQIAEKFRMYKNSPEIAQKHGQSGYEFVCEHFDRRKLADEYIGLIQKMLNA